MPDIPCVFGVTDVKRIYDDDDDVAAMLPLPVWMPNISCLLCDVWVTDVNDDDVRILAF